MISIVATIIEDTLEAELDRFTEDKAMVVRFLTNIDYDKEEGYRYLEMILWRPNNYTGVLIQESWHVVSLEELEENPEDPQYVEGTGELIRYGYHDSCWRDAVRRVLREKKNEIHLLKSGIEGWYKIIDLDDEKKELLREAVNRKKVRPGK